MSTNNSLSAALRQTGEECSPRVSQMNEQGRLKCVTVSSTLQLYALLDLLQYSLNVAPTTAAATNGPTTPNVQTSAPAATLLILDNLEPLLRAQAQAQAALPLSDSGASGTSASAAAAHSNGTSSSSGVRGGHAEGRCMSMSTADLSAKLCALVEAQSVLAMWVCEGGAPGAEAAAAGGTGTGTGAGAGAGAGHRGRGQTGSHAGAAPEAGLKLDRTVHYYPRNDCL